MISDGKGTLEIKKLDGNWKIDGIKVDVEKVDNILSVVLNREGKNYELVSQNPNRFTDLNVSSTSAKLTLKSGTAEKLTLIIGNSSYPGTFVRPKKENNVYLTAQSLNNVSTTDRQSYFDKALFTFQQSSIQKISINNGKESYILTKTDNKWKLENTNKDADESKLNELLSNLQSLKADKVIENPRDKSGYAQKYGSVTVETTEAKSETIGVSKGKNDFLLERKSDGGLFTLSETSVSNILKKSSDLVK